MYYIRNAQGDIIGLFDKTGAKVVSYQYDSWGKLISIDGSLKDSVGVKNPYRYRGYRYDEETGLFYVGSRYYDPNTCRFINADEPAMLTLNVTNLIGANLFAYCNNNPVMYSDPDGHGPVGAIIGGILGFGLGALIIPYIADQLHLHGWGRKLFIGGGVAAITGIGVYAGWYIGEAIFKIYQAGGAFAAKIDGAIARGIAKVVGGSIKAAKGSGWIIKVGKLTLRVMSGGGSRVNYFRLSMEGKGAMTLSGAFSGDRAATHIDITFSNIVKIVSTILKYK